MRDSFAAYYRPTDEQFKELWQKATFVLDANVLLNLYRYRKEASSELLQTLSKIKTRLWVPHQAALEYQENRLSVIAEQLGAFTEVRSELTKSLTNLRDNLLSKLQLRKRHSSINADHFLEHVDKTFSDFIRNLDDLKKGQPDVTDADKLRNTIDELLKGRVGPPPKDQSSLDAIYEAGKRRYAERRPPGYADDGKKDFYFSGSLSFQRQYGDLVLWEEIVEEAAKQKLTHLVFLTDDEKEDWWWIEDSQGKKTIGPRPELVDEINRRAKVSLFYMYTSERFLTYAREFLGVTVKPDTIDEIRAVGLQAQLKGDYKSEIISPEPVAIKLRQNEVHAPNHEDWGTVTCDACGEQFGLGYNRLYGPGGLSAEECAANLNKILLVDHLFKRQHANSVLLGSSQKFYGGGLPTMQLPNYQFTCPKCGLPITIVWNAPIDERQNVSFNLECTRPLCGWRGELPASAGRPI